MSPIKAERFVLLAAMGQPAAAQSLPPSQVVAPVDLKRYAGVWYEQARLPNRFQEKCAGQVSARYSLRADGRIDVLNRCVRSPGDVEEALNAAAQIGDDKLTGGTVRPENFTHGTSAQRVTWFKRGIGSGRMADCNTFEARAL